jgi:acyl-homoserine-lactone acylase
VGVEVPARRSAKLPLAFLGKGRYRATLVKDEPGNGAPGDPPGVFRVSQFIPAKDGKFKLVHGDTYYAAVEFGPTVRAKVLIAYGNSTQPNSPHMGDQIPLYVKQQMRDAWLSKADVEANLEKRDTLR